MNIVWTLCLILSISLILFTSPTLAIDSMISATTKAVTLCIDLIAIYAVWLGFLELLEAIGVNKKLAKIFKPLTKFLFGDINDKSNEQICINLSSNFLGMGNAATPSGIKAMQYLSDGSGSITNAMSMLIILNTTCLQLLPTTIVGLRITNSSSDASSIIIPTFLTSLISTILGVFLIKMFGKIFRKSRRNRTKGESD